MTHTTSQHILRKTARRPPPGRRASVRRPLYMLLNAQMLTALDTGVNVSASGRASTSVSTGEDGSSSRPSRHEVLPLFPLEGQESDRGPGVFLDLLLCLVGAVPGGYYETALFGDDLPEHLIAFSLAGVSLAELRCLPQHIRLDLAQ